MIFMGRRRRIFSSAVIFHANLLHIRMMRTTGILCEVPMCCFVICRMHLSLMVKLCSEDKIFLDLVYVNDVPKVRVLDQIPEILSIRNT